MSSVEVAFTVLGALVGAVLFVLIILCVLDKTGTMDVKKSAEDTRRRIMGIVNPNYDEFGKTNEA